MKLRFIFTAFTITSTLLFQGCMNPAPKKIANTASGNPEVIIKNISKAEIHDAFINHFLSSGATIEKDTGYNIFFTFPLSKSESAGRSFADSIRDGNEGESYLDGIDVALIDTAGGTRVIMRIYYITQFRSGRISKTLNTSHKVFNHFQSFLNRIKDNVDKAH